MSIRNKRSSGFTLVELLLVISIIAILSALGVSVMAGAEQDALETRTKAGIERISQALNRKFEENIYRILPVRVNADADPQVFRDFREGVMSEFLRVEFPFAQSHVQGATFPMHDPAGVGVLTNLDRPQISARYEGRLGGAWITKPLLEVDLPNPAEVQRLCDLYGPFVQPSSTAPARAVVHSRLPAMDFSSFDLYVGGSIVSDESIPVVDAECLYTILSLSFDENGNSLVSILREREIGDTDNDGAKEVLDAFGDPLQFSLLWVPPSDLNDLITNGQLVEGQANDIVQSDSANGLGYEVILDQTAALNPGQVRGPRPIDEYRISIWSVNVSNRDGSAVVTQ